MDHSYAKTKYLVGRQCCVPCCGIYKRPGISFHLFPKDKKRRKEWENALQLNKPISSAMKVCSYHFLASDYYTNDSRFQKLSSTAVPSQNIMFMEINNKDTDKKESLFFLSKLINIDNENQLYKTVSTQAYIVDKRNVRPQNGRSLADILCEYEVKDKCTQVNHLPIWKEELMTHHL